MIDKFAGAIKDLRAMVGESQVEFAKKLGVGVPSLAHYETAGRRPEAVTTALLCRTAHDAGRIDLGEVFAAALPGVGDGLLVPCWRLPNTPRIRVERIPAEELSDHQIEQLMSFGKREADLIDRMEAAARAGDRDLVWELAEALVRCQDKAVQVHAEKAKGNQGEP